LLKKNGQVLAEAEEVTVEVERWVVAGVWEVALAPRQLSMVAAFEQHRLSGGHTMAAEVSADQVSHLDIIMVAIA